MHRSAFASLLALIALATGATVVAGMLAFARSTTLTGMATEQRLATDALLDDGEAFACAWLDTRGPSVVLPPHGGGLLVIDHTWKDAHDRPCRLAILACDALATLPPAALVAGHPLRLAMSSPGTAPVLSTSPTTIAAGDLLGSISRSNSWDILPHTIPPQQPVGSTIAAALLSPQSILALWFSPDNPGAINVNTAPASLLRAAAPTDFDVETILSLRRAGRRWEGASRSGLGEIQLVATSANWNLLLVAEIGHHHQARWAVGDGVAGRMRIIRRTDATPAPATTPHP